MAAQNMFPHKVDDDAGIGRQLVSGDLNADGLPDIVAANKNGTFVFTQRRRSVDQDEWKKAQPMRLKGF